MDLNKALIIRPVITVKGEGRLTCPDLGMTFHEKHRKTD